MSAARVGWALWLAFVATLTGAIYIGFNPPAGEPISVIDAMWAISFVGFPTAGALIITRIPRRPLGWLLSVGPLLLIFGVFCSELAKVGLGEGPVALGEWIYWLGTVTFNAGVGLLLLTLLFLPDGLLPSRRWRLVVWPVVVYLVLSIIAAAVSPWTIEGGGGNPIGIESLRWFFDLSEALLGVAAMWTLGFGVLSLIVRFRRSIGIERQQLKVLALGAMGVVASFAALALIEAILGDQSDLVATLFVIAAILSLPTAIAMAVTRHRLYDVDVIINRTLVYTGLTGILVLAYLGIVFVLQQLLSGLTRDSDLAVAASTLAVAALFRPLKTGVQSFIDRRFYRRKYDAEGTLNDFSSRLRDEVDLDALGHDLVSVVSTTMQPIHASLWLRQRGVE